MSFDINQYDASIDSLQHETRVFPPPPEIAADAHCGSLAEYEQIYQRLDRRPGAFLGRDRQVVLVAARGIACSSGNCRTRNGSSAA